MDFVTHSHRHGLQLLESEFNDQWLEIQSVLRGISDSDLMDQFPRSKNKMSISSAINDLIKARLTEKNWLKEAPIFQDPEYSKKAETVWRLDFAKQDISVEVSFNHGEALAWNLTKPILASELNHVRKAIQTKIGIIILATQELKEAGAFDGAVGTYEKAIRYLKPMNDLLTVPLILVGLKAPTFFKVIKRKENGKNRGVIQPIK